MVLVPRSYTRHDSFARLMDEMLQSPAWEDMPSRSLAADLYETAETVVVETSIPGVKPEDISINIVGDVLTITGKSTQVEETEKRDYYQKQLHYGSFAQSVTLPAAVASDNAEAHFNHGILKVVLPKAEEAKPKQIQISVS